MAIFKHFAKPRASADFEVLIASLLRGEILAARVSKAQARYFKDSHPDLAHFFQRQSRQETFHAKLFRSTLLWLNPKSQWSHRRNPAFDSLERQLLIHLEQDRPEASILGLQVMVECVGEATLGDLDLTINNYGSGLKKIRQIVLNQEHAHHDFGQRYFAKLAQQQKQGLQQAAADFRAEIDAVIKMLSPSFDEISISSDQYMALLDQELSSVLRFRDISASQ